MRYTYPMIVHNDADGLWCEFPDMNGCFTQGDNINDLMANAQEALEGCLLTMLECGIKIKPASDICTIKTTESTFTSLVSVNVSFPQNSKSVKKTVTIPEWMNETAMARGFNFSQILQEGIMQKIAQ